MEMRTDLKIEFITGPEIKYHLAEVAAFRIKYLSEFPYLYRGNLEYETKYLESYGRSPRALLIKIKSYDNELLGVSTGLPLQKNASILDFASKNISELGLEAEKIYYYGEVILDHSIRGQGLCRFVYSLQDRFAKENGFSKIVIATVVRENSDLRRPSNYSDSDGLWSKLGFQKTKLKFEYLWPSFQKNGDVSENSHPMVYWFKDLTKSPLQS